MAMVWENDIIPNPELPLPQTYGWMEDGDYLVPIMNTMPPAPDAIIHLVKCGCKSSRCFNLQCSCKNNKLHCTDLCGCCDVEECENLLQIEYESGDGDDDDDDDEFENN